MMPGVEKVGACRKGLGVQIITLVGEKLEILKEIKSTKTHLNILLISDNCNLCSFHFTLTVGINVFFTV